MNLVGTRMCVLANRTILGSREFVTTKSQCGAANYCHPAAARMKSPGASAYFSGNYRCTSSIASLCGCECTRARSVKNVDAMAIKSYHCTNLTTRFDTKYSRSRSRYSDFWRLGKVNPDQDLTCLECRSSNVNELNSKIDFSGPSKVENQFKVQSCLRNDLVLSYLPQRMCKSGTFHPFTSGAKYSVDNLQLISPGISGARKVNKCHNLTVWRTFRAYSGCFAKDSNDSKDGLVDEELHEEGIEEWIHPDDRSDLILNKDAELKSLLRELASDFGKEALQGADDPENRTTENMEDESKSGTKLEGDVKMKTFDTEGLETFEPISAEREEQREKKFVLSIDDLVSILRDENAQDICVINIPKKKQYVDYFVVVTGRSPRHLKAMALHINQQYKSRKSREDPFVLVEGEGTDDWICVDFGNIALHIMSEETREFYELEKLWTLGPEYDDQLRRLKEHEIKVQETLDSVDVGRTSNKEQEGNDDGKPVLSFAR
ncbi:uncharacterized protein LOC583777 isoform X1 [Strongylocentrotus purpuratus]|uniref:Mitochondrial assembly of ribosomal large subunit protein 1 n=1 Tax=Strongylocentrotus purpuratus TaxID=7668 RepID=A0A7M7STS8_STRPU|nr:uncharacterized protein LOC583777 isoform X1 [Strongylocentrotus purpuratus]